MKRVGIWILLSLMTTLLGAQTFYFNAPTPLQAGKESMGEALILTPAQIVKDSGNEVTVKIVGVMNENYTEAIQRSIKNGEILATLTRQDSPALKILSKSEDEYGENWLNVEVVAEVPKSSLDADPNALYSKAKGVYNMECSTCHKLHPADQLRSSQWPGAIRAMLQYVGWDEATKTLVVKYLQQHALDAQ